MPAFETDKFPFVKARFFTPSTAKRAVRLIVIHSMEAPEKGETAENVAHFFTDPRNKKGQPVKVSAHLCIDNNSIVQCVLDNDVAFAAPGANRDGVHIELAGFAKQTEAEWLDAYGVLLLDQAANATAQYALKFDITVRRLTNAELADKSQRGFVGHSQVSEVFKLSDHGDPGPGFPWAFFLERVRHHHALRLAKLNAGNGGGNGNG